MGNLPVKFIKNFEISSKILPPTDIMSTFKMLMEIKRENDEVKKEIKKIEATKELLIHEMTLKFDLYHKVFGQIFDERKQSINKSFEIIDRGLKENDKDLISMGLNSLSQVVSASPFSNLAELSKLLEGGGRIEI